MTPGQDQDAATELDAATMAELQPPCEQVDVDLGYSPVQRTDCVTAAVWIARYHCACGHYGTELMCEYHRQRLNEAEPACTACRMLGGIIIDSVVAL